MNSGLSPKNAWQTINKINSYQFEFGDSILLRSGSIWREELIIPQHGIFIQSYGDGNFPIIKGSEILNEWIHVENDIWRHKKNYSIGWIWVLDSDQNIQWGKKIDQKSNLSSDHQFFLDSNSVYLHSKIDPNNSEITIEASVRDFGIISGWYSKAKNSIAIKEVEICFTKNSNIRSVGSSDWKIENTILHHSGAIDESDGQGIQYEGTKCLISKNILYENGQHGIYLSSFGNADVRDNIIEQNELFNNYHTAIDLMNDGGNENSHSQTIIRRNIIYDLPNFSGNEIGIQLLGYLEGMIKNVIIHHNLIKNINGIGISIMNNSDSVMIHNNTIINSKSACVNVNNGENIAELYNNVGINDKYYAVLFIHESKNKYVDFNIWHSGNQEKTKNIFVDGRYYNVDSIYRKYTGFDVNGSFSNPKINDSNIKKIRLMSESICIDRGRALNYEFDVYGNEINKPVDIGAVEFISN
jgi:hypothetical protein